MALCNEADINTFLDASKIVVTSGDDADEIRDAEAIVRSQLAGHIDSSVLASWTTPLLTPDLIRGIAGRLVAAFRYRKLVSEDSDGKPSPYAQMLYNEAMSMLMGVVNGDLLIAGVEIAANMGLDSSMFYPNAAANEDVNEAAKFTWSTYF